MSKKVLTTEEIMDEQKQQMMHRSVTRALPKKYVSSTKSPIVPLLIRLQDHECLRSLFPEILKLPADLVFAVLVPVA